MRYGMSALIVAAVLAGCGKDDGLAPVSASARVKFVNLIGGATPVDFAAADQRIFTSLAFTTVAPALPGTYTALAAETPQRLRVYLGSATLIDSTVTLLADASYTVVATGTSNGTGTAAARFAVLQDNITVPAAGAIRIRVVHAATTVGVIDVHAVLAGTQFGSTTRVFANVALRGAGTVDVPEGTYQICAIAAGATPTVTGSSCAIFVSTGVVPVGSVITVYARDPKTPSEATPQLQIAVDRTP